MKEKRRLDKAMWSLAENHAESKIEAQSSKIKTLEGHVKLLSGALQRSREKHKIVSVSPKVSSSSKEEIVRVIIPDTHGSSIDPVASGAFLSDLKTLDPDEIVMLGDHVDCGGFLAQHHTLGFVAQTAYSYEEDVGSANAFLDQVQKLAPRARIYYIEGNHELRIERWAVTTALSNSRDSEMIRKALAPQYLLRLKERGISYYRQCEHYMGIRIPGAIKLGKCFFWHSVSSATNAAAVNLHQFGANVVFAHVHREHSASGVPVGLGDIGAWCPGALCLKQPLWQHTRPTNWTTGYGIQLQARSQNFLHINARIVDGCSMVLPLINNRSKEKKK